VKGVREMDTQTVQIVLMIAGVIYLAVRIFVDYRTVTGEPIDKYMDKIIRVFSYVEKVVPDDFGKDDTDPAWAKAIHKLDVATIRFSELYRSDYGKEPSLFIVKEAKKAWTMLAHQKSQEITIEPIVQPLTVLEDKED